MKTKSVKLRMDKRFNMYCRECDFVSNDGLTNSPAKTHAKNTGHAVEVYWEIGRVIKPIN